MTPCTCGHLQAEHFFDRLCLRCMEEPRPYQHLPDGTFGPPPVRCHNFTPAKAEAKP